MIRLHRWPARAHRSPLHPHGLHQGFLERKAKLIRVYLTECENAIAWAALVTPEKAPSAAKPRDNVGHATSAAQTWLEH